MIDNKILKHKFMLFLFVFVSSFLIYDFAVKAAENVSDFYNWEIVEYSYTDVTYPYKESHFNFQSLEKLALILQGDSSYILVSASSNYTINFNDKCPVLIKFYDGNQQYSHEKNVTYLSKDVISVDSINDISSILLSFESNWKPLETNIPIFGTLSQAQNYFKTGDTTGQINKVSNFHDFSQDIYTVDIPVPELSKLCFMGFDINNNPNDIYNVDLIIQTNYYGVSYQKKGLVNVYAVDYDWIYKKHYYNISDSKSKHVKKSQINVLGDFGVDIFSDYVSDFISWGRDYPNITDLPNYSFIWYNSAASQTYYNIRHVQEDLIDETTLKMTGQPEVIYYVRFYDDSGNFGRWARYSLRADDVKLRSVVNVGQLDIGEDGSYIIDDNGNPSTSQTITTNQNLITNETEDNRLDFDITSATNFFDYIKSIFDSIISSLNSFGNLIKACLGFLPDDLLNAIFAGIVIMLFVGVVKVVRG